MLPFRDQKIVGGKGCRVTKNMGLYLLLLGVNSIEGYYAIYRWYCNEILQLSMERYEMVLEQVSFVINNYRKKM